MEEINLYKNMFAPDLQHQTLAFIGCAIATGAHPPVEEFQCRVAAQVFKVCDSTQLGIRRLQSSVFCHM